MRSSQSFTPRSAGGTVGEGCAATATVAATNTNAPRNQRAERRRTCGSGDAMRDLARRAFEGRVAHEPGRHLQGRCPPELPMRGEQLIEPGVANHEASLA